MQNLLGAVGRAEPPADLQQRIIRACRDASPVETIGCDECLELASAYLDDELHGARRDAFEAHVFACEPCYFAFKQMERTTEGLRDVPPATVPAGLHERITAAVERDRREREPAHAFNWRRTAQVLGGLAAAAALLAAVFVPRGGDGTAPTAPVIAEAPSAISIDSADETEPATEPVEAAADETAETSEAAPSEPSAVAVAPSVREASRTRAASSRSAGTRTTRPEPEPVRATTPAPRPEIVGEEATSAPAPRTRPERTTRTRRTAAETPQPERTVRQPEPDPEPAPVAAEDRPAPSPEPARVPEVAPDPPARDPQPRESVIAATPRPDPEPAPVSTSGPAPQPVATSSAPKPRGEQGRERLAVVPRQPHSRAVYKPEPTPPATRSERLSRMAEGINGSQNPRMDNPSPGIILN